jgi:magnesium transporter
VKVLTILNAVSLPALVIASIYGMNFQRPWPAFDWPYGFVFSMALMVLTTTGLLLWLRRKHWF